MHMAMPKFFSHVVLEKGYRYAYNYLHFLSFYNTRKPWLVKLLQKIEPYPAYIEIENTTYCNLKCTMCEHTYWKEKARSLSFEQFKAVVDQFPRLKWIGLTGIGESYLNRDFHKMLRYCKEERKLIVEIYDAFYFVEEEQSRELIDLGIEQIYCSMDGATKDTYETIRRGSNFDTVVKNLRRFVELKRARGVYFPVLDFHFIVNKINAHEMIPYIELIADIAPGSKIQFTRLLHRYPEIDHLYQDIDQAMIDKAYRRAAELGVQMFWNQNVGSCKPPIRNCITWYMPFIFVTGEVIPCCSGNEANRRENQKATSLGNVFEQPFQEIWWGEKYRDFRRQLRAGAKPVPCTDCCLYSHGEVAAS
jgi:MoaA/NifB/PqqE/SkfB family radical SAM enzyme